MTGLPMTRPSGACKVRVTSASRSVFPLIKLSKVLNPGTIANWGAYSLVTPLDFPRSIPFTAALERLPPYSSVKNSPGRDVILR